MCAGFYMVWLHACQNSPSPHTHANTPRDTWRVMKRMLTHVHVLHSHATPPPLWWLESRSRTTFYECNERNKICDERLRLHRKVSTVNAVRMSYNLRPSETQRCVNKWPAAWQLAEGLQNRQWVLSMMHLQSYLMRPNELYMLPHLMNSLELIECVLFIWLINNRTDTRTSPELSAPIGCSKQLLNTSFKSSAMFSIFVFVSAAGSARNTLS